MSRKLFLQVSAPAVLIGLILVGVCLASVWSINRLQANLTSILAENVTQLEAAGTLEVKLRQLRFHTLMYVLDPTDSRLSLLDEDEQGFESALAIARRTSDPTIAELVARISAGYEDYLDRRPRTVEFASGPWTREHSLIWADANPVRPLLKECQNLIRRNREAMEATARESERVGGRVRLAMILLAIVGPIGGLVAGMGITRGLSRSIAQLRVRVEDVRSQLNQDVGTVQVVADGGIHGLDKDLGHILTRLREVVEQAQQREREALRAEQLAAVGQLAAGVAHEIRNPLTSMKMLVEAALTGDELTHDDLQVINGEIQRIEQTATGLLDFARPSPPHREVTDLGDLIRSATELIKGRAVLQHVVTELPNPVEPILAAVDAAQFKGVILNLLLNALDAMPGGGRLLIDLERNQQDHIRLTIRDTGSGIAPEILPRLFEPFASTKDTGTGLGLSVSRRVVRAHGGEIHAESILGGGTAFTITMPGGDNNAEAIGY
jgi:two-component system sensor histidine kinase HydH